MKRFIFLLILVIALVGCGDSQASQPTPTPQTTPDSAIVWQDGSLHIFHSDGGNYNGVGGMTDPFTVPAVWRVKWFCVPGSDPTQAFFGISVEHAGDLSSADGSTPLQVDCGQTPNGTLTEHVGGSVTLQLLAGTGTTFDVYVQTPVGS